MMSEMESLVALANFVNKLKFAKRMKNESVIFKSKIIYEWNNNIEEENLQVSIQLSGIEGGKISLEEGEILNTSKVYMDFIPKFQEYQYSKEGTLIVKGFGKSSQKNWNYKVTIIDI